MTVAAVEALDATLLPEFQDSPALLDPVAEVEP